MTPSKEHATWLINNQLVYIKEEASKTKPSGMSMYEAVQILIHERYERNILNREERDYLLHEITVGQIVMTDNILDFPNGDAWLATRLGNSGPRIMMGNVVIRAPQYGVEKVFEHPRDAYAFVEECKKKKIDQFLEIENNSGVSLSAYNPRIPRDAQELIEKLEQAHGGNTVPLWHWIVKDASHRYGTGHTYYTRNSGKMIRVAVSSSNQNPNDYLGVVVHEFVHSLLPKNVQSHGKLFYQTLFKKLYEFVSAECIKWTLRREFSYKKSSRYWYAEMYNIESILQEYRRPEVQIAARLSPEEKKIQAVNALFGEE